MAERVAYSLSGAALVFTISVFLQTFVAHNYLLAALNCIAVVLCVGFAGIILAIKEGQKND